MLKNVKTGVVAASIAALLSLHALAMATTAPAAITTRWHTQPVVKITVTPNYASGYGAILARFGGTTQTPQYGPGAPAAIDFGSVLAGSSYLYKYAAHVNVATNDPSGFYLYAEGTANFINTSTGYAPLSSTLFYVNSAASGDTNNGFNASAFPFNNTSGSVSGSIPPNITYSAFPQPINNPSSANGDFYYDYLLKVPATGNAASYSIWVVYTVVPK